MPRAQGNSDSIAYVPISQTVATEVTVLFPPTLFLLTSGMNGPPMGVEGRQASSICCVEGEKKVLIG